MNANDKQNKVDEAIEKMMEIADSESIRLKERRIDNVKDEAYEYARGSNSRKNELAAGYRAAIRRTREIEAAKAAQIEEGAPTAAEKIDANKIAVFPTTGHGRVHYVTIPQPKPAMTDEERDTYVTENVIYPDNFFIESIYVVRESAESKDFKIRIGFSMKPEAK